MKTGKYVLSVAYISGRYACAFQWPVTINLKWVFSIWKSRSTRKYAIYPLAHVLYQIYLIIRVRPRHEYQINLIQCARSHPIHQNDLIKTTFESTNQPLATLDRLHTFRNHQRPVHHNTSEHYAVCC